MEPKSAPGNWHAIAQRDANAKGRSEGSRLLLLSSSADGIFLNLRITKWRGLFRKNTRPAEASGPPCRDSARREEPCQTIVQNQCGDIWSYRWRTSRRSVKTASLFPVSPYLCCEIVAQRPFRPSSRTLTDSEHARRKPEKKSPLISDQIGIATRLQRTNLVRPAEQICGIDCSSLNGSRASCPIRTSCQTASHCRVGVDAGIGAKPASCRTGGVPEIFTLQTADLLFLFDGLRSIPACAFLQM